VVAEEGQVAADPRAEEPDRPQADTLISTATNWMTTVKTIPGWALVTSFPSTTPWVQSNPSP